MTTKWIHKNYNITMEYLKLFGNIFMVQKVYFEGLIPNTDTGWRYMTVRKSNKCRVDDNLQIAHIFAI